MPEYKLGALESVFADIFWTYEPLSSRRLAQERLQWKRATSYTILKRLCDRGLFQNRADYAASLLGLATRRRFVSGTPLAFGEGDTKGRVFHMAGWKTPRLRTGILCTALCIAVLAAVR